MASVLRPFRARCSSLFFRSILSSRPSFRSLATVSQLPPEQDWEDVPAEKQAELLGEPAKLSIHELKEKLHPLLFKALTHAPFKLTHTTPVQAEIFSLLPDIARLHSPEDKGSRDLLVKAKTGTGKTLGFLIPAVQGRLNKLEQIGKEAQADGDGLQSDISQRAVHAYARANAGILIISPTRELASQIAAEATKLTSHLPGFGVCLFTGGIGKGNQMREWLRGRRDIVVATPGRLIDLLDSEPKVSGSFDELQTFILDEADTLVEIGFREATERIRTFLPGHGKRTSLLQTFLFSATIHRSIEEVAQQFLHPAAKFIDCVKGQENPTANHIKQHFSVLPSPDQQIPHLMRLLALDQLTHPGKSKIIVFTPTTKMTMLFATLLRELSATTLPKQGQTKVWEIHSQKDQRQRTAASMGFRKGYGGGQILVTSDVSARGVDYPDVTRVIQMGIPSSDTHYIHRIGRTGRAGKIGQADLILLPWEIGFVNWKLKGFPITSMPLDQISARLHELVKEHDEDPVLFAGENHKPYPISTLSHLPATLPTEIATFLARVDSYAVKDTCMSLLGYYVTKTGELRCHKESILEGCKSWATEAFGMDNAPVLSSDFLRKIGFSSGGSSRYGRNSESLPRLRGKPEGTPRWTGRGRTSQYTPTSSSSGSWSDRQDSNVGERSTPRYGDRKPSYGGEGKRSYGGEERRSSYGGEGRREEKQAWGGGEKRSFGDKPSYGGERKQAWGGGEKRSYETTKRPWDGEAKKSWGGEGKRSYDGEQKRSYGGEKRSYGGEGRQSYGGEGKRSYGEDTKRSWSGESKRRSAFA